MKPPFSQSPDLSVRFPRELPMEANHHPRLHAPLTKGRLSSPAPLFEDLGDTSNSGRNRWWGTSAALAFPIAALAPLTPPHGHAFDSRPTPRATEAAVGAALPSYTLLSPPVCPPRRAPPMGGGPLRPLDTPRPFRRALGLLAAARSLLLAHIRLSAFIPDFWTRAPRPASTPRWVYRLARVAPCTLLQKVAAALSAARGPAPSAKAGGASARLSDSPYSLSGRSTV